MSHTLLSIAVEEKLPAGGSTRTKLAPLVISGRAEARIANPAATPGSETYPPNPHWVWRRLRLSSYIWRWERVFLSSVAWLGHGPFFGSSHSGGGPWAP